MSNGTFWLELKSADESITITGSSFNAGVPSLILTNTGVTGLYGTPTAKVTLTERQTGNGAHPVPDERVLYSTRTVTINFAAITTASSPLLTARTMLARLTGRNIRLYIHDNGETSYLTGYMSLTWSGKATKSFDTGVITLVCPDPIRYSTAIRQLTLWPASAGGQGLVYTDGKALAYPLTYGDNASGGDHSTGMLTNSGSVNSYPVITVHGHFADGVAIDWDASDGTSGALAWQGDIGLNPLTLDCKSGTASMGSIDQSAGLVKRSFPHVPPAGTLTMALRTTGAGQVTATSHDTWI